jgi:FtsP/CotA-like multicopper oxidase with cupredoxin domain
MNHLLLFLRRVLIVFLVGTFISVSTFRGEAIADDGGNGRTTVSPFTVANTTDKIVPFVNSCSLKRTNQANQPVFKNPPFADADKGSVTLRATKAQFTLEGNGKGEDTKYDGYLYGAIYINREKIETNSPPTYTPPVIEVSPSKQPSLTPTTIAYNQTDKKENNYLNVKLINDLPVNVQLAGKLPQTIENLESVSQYTNIHYHGFNVSPLLGGDNVLVEVPSNVTPKPINIPTRNQNEIELDGTATSDDVKVTYNTFIDNKYKLIPVPPLGDVTPDSTKVEKGNLPGGYYPDDDPENPKYGEISEYNMGFLIPDVHQSGLFWYHSHAHTLSDDQVRAGLSGGIIVKGSEEYYKQFLPPAPPPLSKTGEQILAAAPEYEANSLTPEIKQQVMMFKDFNDTLGTTQEDCFILNGQVNPKITIKPGEIQLWRIGNIGADNYMNIALENQDFNNPQFTEPNGNPNFYILARDSNVVDHPVATDSVLLPPAARVELLVVGGKVGTTYNLVSDLTTNLTEKQQKWMYNPPDSKKNKSYVLATINVDNDDTIETYTYTDADGQESTVSVCDSNTTGQYCSDGTTINLDYFIKNEKPYKIDDILYEPELLAKLTDEAPKDDKDLLDKLGVSPEGLKELKESFGCDTEKDVSQCPKLKENLKKLRIVPSSEYCTNANNCDEPLTTNRYFYFTANAGKFFIKGYPKAQEDYKGNTIGDLFDGNRIDKVSHVGDVEEWNVVNATGQAHVFHMHQLDFIVTKLTLPIDKYPEPPKSIYDNYEIDGECSKSKDSKNYICPLKTQGYRDVINLPAKSTTTIRIPFVNPFITGVFVYHCHILGHEDRGMMQNLKVINPKGYSDIEMKELQKAANIINERLKEPSGE